MIEVQELISETSKKGYTFFSGVPCSILTPIHNYILSCENLKYATASSEGEAVGIAAGAYLAGQKAIVLCQNSGLGNMVNPLTSLNFPFGIPLLLFISLRGESGQKDEPQHELMGQITLDLLDTLRIPWSFLADNINDFSISLDQADKIMGTEIIPYAFIIRKDTIFKFKSNYKWKTRGQHSGEISGQFFTKANKRMKRIDAMRILRHSLSSDDLIVATTGKTGRELYSLGDNPNQIYVVGSMGCASGIGLGIQMIRPDQSVVVFDGDGAALMKLGTMATIGHYQPKKFIHILFDNEVYESTGKQPTVSRTVDFAGIASACGYSGSWRVDDPNLISDTVAKARKLKGPALIHLKVAAHSDPAIGRPKVKPQDKKKNLMYYLESSKRRL